MKNIEIDILNENAAAADDDDNDDDDYYYYFWCVNLAIVIHLKEYFFIVLQMSIMHFSAKRRKVDLSDGASSSQPEPANASASGTKSDQISDQVCGIWEMKCK